METLPAVSLDREYFEAALASVSPTAREALTSRFAWTQLAARPDQIPPDETDLSWFIWLMMGGRGAGKTRSGAEDAWWFGFITPGARIAIVAPTSDDCRKTCFEGESGLIARCPRSLIANWNRGEKVLTLTNGTIFQGYSAEEPERLRGPQHHRAWCDEIAAWRHLDATMDMLLMGMRLGKAPRIVATTTPRPLRRIKEIASDKTTRLDHATTYDNQGNLPAIFLDMILKRYKDTRLGRQELLAQLLTDMPGALWSLTQIDKLRTTGTKEFVIGRSGQKVAIKRIVVAVDPATKSKAGSDEWGIVVCALGDDGRGYVLADLSQGGTPAEVGEIAVRAYDEWGADRMIYEGNQGGEMVLHVLETAAKDLRQRGEREVDFISTQEVWASRGKVTRAEPVSALYEQSRVAHVGQHAVLEDQMGEFTSDFKRDEMGYSPDRVDALVWGITHLMLTASDGTNVMDYYRNAHSTMVEKAEAARTGGASVKGMVRLIPPVNVTSASGRDGTGYLVGEEGWMEVRPDDVVPLIMAGFRRWTEDVPT